MSDLIQQTRFIVQRLAQMNVTVQTGRDGQGASGHLTLTDEPLEAFGRPIVIRKARFYTLGHCRLKFYDPQVLFDLPAVDISRCESAADVDQALRRVWGERRRRLRAAKDRLGRLGCDIGSGAHGTRLLMALTGMSGPPAVVLAPDEILIPSSGPLRNRSAGGPADRIFKPALDVEHASELELSLGQQAERLGRRDARRVRALQRPEKARPAGDEATLGRSPGRILVLDHDPSALAEAETLLRLCGFDVDGQQDPLRALGAFAERSYDAVIVDARMPRISGLEFTARLREIPGIDELPVVLLDDRPNPKNQSAAETLRAAAYLAKPPRWRDLGEWLSGRLEQMSRRRFDRYPTRITAEVTLGEGAARDLVHTVSRGGFGLRSRRPLAPRTLSTYRLALPLPHKPVQVQGEVIHCDPTPGRATLHAGIRIHRFLHQGEVRWVRLIESLARHTPPTI